MSAPSYKLNNSTLGPETLKLAVFPNGALSGKTVSPSLANFLLNTLQVFTLSGKVPLITGAARGLGYEIARAIVECGTEGVVLLDRKAELVDKAAEEIRQTTGVPIAVQQVLGAFGYIDVVINSTGIADSNIKAEDYDPEMFRRLIDINLTGSFLIARVAARHMIAPKALSSIVFIASAAAQIATFPQEQCAYNASKAGVVYLGRLLAAEWARYHIRVNCISPGYMDTELNRVGELEAQKSICKSVIPQKRLGDVPELNNLAVYLASDSSSLMTGANCVIDGGLTLY
ncbi:hypothetical protein HAV15_000648 [Penicillium sp. str. |nr:hypothetical protein HAV15_000648 [Penicillium sp. str. \